MTNKDDKYAALRKMHSDRRTLAGPVPKWFKEIGEILAERDAIALENQKFREKYAALYAGSMLYSDDGELQDNRAIPCIDFKRDSIADIESKMMKRMQSALDETERFR